jgi:uncharacterized membrane protein HdeD (DUF308 family)
MNKYQSLKLYGFLIVVAGLLLLSFQYSTFAFVQYAVAFSLIVSAIFALITAYKNQNVQIRYKYHELHALGMLCYGVALLFYAVDIPSFLTATSFFFIYYGMTELIFCFQLLNDRAILSLEVLIIRFVMGFAIYLGAPIILHFAASNQIISMRAYGIMFLISGIHVILFQTVLKNMDKQGIAIP